MRPDSGAGRLQREINKIEQTLPPELPASYRQVLAYNLATRDLSLPDRHCPACDKRYRLLGGEESGKDRVKEEQHRSGICSEECFLQLNGVPLSLMDQELDTPDRPRPDVRFSAFPAFPRFTCTRAIKGRRMCGRRLLICTHDCRVRPFSSSSTLIRWCRRCIRTSTRAGTAARPCARTAPNARSARWSATATASANRWLGHGTGAAAGCRLRKEARTCTGRSCASVHTCTGQSRASVHTCQPFVFSFPPFTKDDSDGSCLRYCSALSWYVGTGAILAVKLSCDRMTALGTPLVQTVTLPRSDGRLFEGIDPEAGTCPVPAMLGVPIVVRRLAAPECCTERAHFDNQWATWLHIEPAGGMAPMLWQSWIGPVVVYRADGGDLTDDDVSVLADCVSTLIDEYGEGPGAVVPERDITPQTMDNAIEMERLNHPKAALTLHLSTDGREQRARAQVDST